MSVYGAKRKTTPAIDRLAARAVRFTNVFSPSPWTLPAHAAMLTGRYPSALAHDANDLGLYRAAPLLSMLFKDAGYNTGAVTGRGYVSAAFGANRGFDSFGAINVEKAVTWIEQNRDHPFFFFFHTYACHGAYHDKRYTEHLAAGRYKDLYKGKPDKPSLAGFAFYNQVVCGTVQPSAVEKRFLRALYDGGVAIADELVDTLISTLSRLGLLEKTAVIITSDHGEEFWQHTGRAGYHGHTLYDELLRIPLIWYEPHIASPGATIEESVGLIDIVPTVASRFGLSAPVVDGVDLSPLLDGHGGHIDRPLFAEAVRHGPLRFSVRTDRATLIVTPDVETQRVEGLRCPVPVRAQHELYLSDDTGQRWNRFAEHQALARQLAARLEEHLARGAPKNPRARKVPLDDVTIQSLRALGYIK